jgi:isopenicillin-N N-acyltransferase-like protein
MSFPRVVARGAPFARGEQYGAQARERIALCIRSYQALFALRAGLDWPSALGRAARFEPAIAAFAPDCIDEMRGIAKGAGARYEEILALNCRSELMFAALRGTGRVPPGECTSFAVLPSASANGHLLIGQNWDWVPFARDVSVLLTVERESAPGFTTVVEAGMLAKVGLNTAGLAVCTNTLVSTTDNAASGIPYHIILRALLDCESFDAAQDLLSTTERALSANYLIGHSSGEAANFEAAAGGRATLRITGASNGFISHANHFLDPVLAKSDSYVRLHRHSLTRLESMRKALHAGITVEDLKTVLRSHDHAPNGVCGHPDPKANPLQARTTVASVIADLATGEAWITSGPPCTRDYETVRISGLAPVLSLP